MQTVKVGDTGLEVWSDSSAISTLDSEGGAPDGANRANSMQPGADLPEAIPGWEALPDATKAAILNVVQNGANRGD